MPRSPRMPASRWSRYLPHLSIFALCVLIAAGVAEGDKKKKPKKNTLGRPVSVDAMDGPVTLSRVNEAWTGAFAQTRVMIPIKKGQDKQGWSSSEWLRAESETIKMRFSVNSRADIYEVLPQKNLLAGVHLICEGWSVQNPKKGKGIQVDFRFANYPAKARAEFNTDLENLSTVERFLRFNVMGVTKADETLVPAAAAGAASSPAAPPAAPVAATPPPPAAREAAPTVKSLRITSAEVRPTIGRRGGSLELFITYVVASGSTDIVSVRERRILGNASSTLATFEESIDRAPGTYTSRMTINIPPDATPGSYNYTALVDFEDLLDERDVSFEIQ